MWGFIGADIKITYGGWRFFERLLSLLLGEVVVSNERLGRLRPGSAGGGNNLCNRDGVPTLCLVVRKSSSSSSSGFWRFTPLEIVG